MTRARGLSLVEVLVAVGLLAMGSMFILGLLPTGILSLRQAESLQTATAYGMMLIEEVPEEPPRVPARDPVRTFTLNGTRYQATRELVALGEDLFEIRVTVRWDGCRRPVELALRRLR
jgi:Tfp pilus assembly protein PilV